MYYTKFMPEILRILASSRTPPLCVLDSSLVLIVQVFAPLHLFRTECLHIFPLTFRVTLAGA
jgi:hypothetical protein